jgi:hypothetical protein
MLNVHVNIVVVIMMLVNQPFGYIIHIRRNFIDITWLELGAIFDSGLEKDACTTVLYFS